MAAKHTATTAPAIHHLQLATEVKRVGDTLELRSVNLTGQRSPQLSFDLSSLIEEVKRRERQQAGREEELNTLFPPSDEELATEEAADKLRETLRDLPTSPNQEETQPLELHRTRESCCCKPCLIF